MICNLEVKASFQIQNHLQISPFLLLHTMVAFKSQNIYKKNKNKTINMSTSFDCHILSSVTHSLVFLKAA